MRHKSLSLSATNKYGMLCCSGKLLAISILLLRLASANNDAQPTITVSGDKPRRLSIAYYGASNSNVTDGYLSVLKTSGVTDAWVPYMAGAYAMDCCKKNEAAYKAGGLHAGLLSLADVKAQKLVESYSVAGIRPWFFERPVPDFEWTDTPGAIGRGLWNSSAAADAGWSALVANITSVYPQVKALGFEGLVFDNEGYYSGTCKDPIDGHLESCLWCQRDASGNTSANYYKRGRQVGEAINKVWPGARVVMVYGFSYPGLIEWVRGHIDAGLNVLIGNEHTYGAGPCSGPYYKGQWYQCAFGSFSGSGKHHLNELLNHEYDSWPAAPSLRQRMTAGIGPLGLGGYGPPAPQYESRYLQEQLQSALCDQADGPIDVWLWLAGKLDATNLALINRTAAEPGGASDYTSLLYAYSSHNRNETDFCATRS